MRRIRHCIYHQKRLTQAIMSSTISLYSRNALGKESSTIRLSLRPEVALYPSQSTGLYLDAANVFFSLELILACRINKRKFMPPLSASLACATSVSSSALSSLPLLHQTYLAISGY